MDYYDSGTDAFLGETGATAYDVAQSAFMYPTMVVGGSTGTLGTISNYTDSTMSVPVGTTEVTYAVTAPVDPGSPVLVKVTNVSKDPIGNGARNRCDELYLDGQRRPHDHLGVRAERHHHPLGHGPMTGSALASQLV